MSVGLAINIVFEPIEPGAFFLEINSYLSGSSCGVLSVGPSTLHFARRD